MHIEIVKHQRRYIALAVSESATRVVRDAQGRSHFDSIDDLAAVIASQGSDPARPPLHAGEGSPV